MELVGGACAEAYGFDSLRYLAAMTVEESLEMFGAALFLYALLKRLATDPHCRRSPAISSAESSFGCG
jgi:hypothetical protein